MSDACNYYTFQGLKPKMGINGREKDRIDNMVQLASMQPLTSFATSVGLTIIGYSSFCTHKHILLNKNENPHKMKGGEFEPFHYKVDEANKSQHIN
jgi:hypothetical protein